MVLRLRVLNGVNSFHSIPPNQVVMRRQFKTVSRFSLPTDIPTNPKLSDRLPFLFGKACYVFRSENALYGTGHIIGRMMIMKTALLLNTL